MNEFVEGKLALASSLAAGRCGGGTDDAILVVSALLSATAAVLWPKQERTDRKRFVELWARYSDTSLRPNMISLPLLVEKLSDEDRDDAAEAVRLLRPDMIEGIPEFEDSVVSGLAIDVEDTAVVQATGLSLAEVRRYSYGNLFYQHFRSAYVHEYKVGSHGDAFRMSELHYAVLYEGGWAEPPHRRISLDIHWIIEIARSVTKNVLPDWRKRPLMLPTVWWVDGAP
jgi:hypothetical protein